MTLEEKQVKYIRTAYKPYQEWWRERPDETRQPEFIKVPNPAATRDEDSIYTHIESDVRFFCFDGLLKKLTISGKEKNNGKKIIYL